MNLHSHMGQLPAQAELLQGKARGTRSPRVSVLLYDYHTSGPIARADRMCRALTKHGAHVTLLAQSHVINDEIGGASTKKVEIDPKHRWLPSRLNPERAIREQMPDILLVDDYPFTEPHGENNKHMAENVARVIKAARRANPQVKIYSMACEVPVYQKSERTSEIASKAAINVDHIFVTGDPQITDFSSYFNSAQWARFSDKLDYVGYMIPPLEGGIPKKSGEVLVYLGGQPLEANLSMYLRLIHGIPELSESLQRAPWRFVLTANADLRLEKRVHDAIAKLPSDIQSHISVERAGPGYMQKLQAADMLVVRSGQSANEALAYGKPAVILPYNSDEQFDRAKRYAEIGKGRLAVLFPGDTGLKEALENSYAQRLVKPQANPIRINAHDTIARGIIDSYKGIEPNFKGRQLT